MERNFTEQELVRREKAEKLRNLGMDPFGDAFYKDSYALDLKEKYTYSSKTKLLYCFGFLGISLCIAFFWGMIDSKYGFKGYFWRGPVYFYHVVLYCIVDIIVTVRKKHNEKR